MSEFKDRLDRFIESQRGRSPKEAQNAANDFALQLQAQKYVPRERWGNVFKYAVSYALGIGLGHALVAAIARGVDHLAPDPAQVADLAMYIEHGHFDQTSFEAFMSDEHQLTELVSNPGFDFDFEGNDIVDTLLG